MIQIGGEHKCPYCGAELYYRQHSCKECYMFIEWELKENQSCRDCRERVITGTGKCAHDCTNQEDWQRMMTPLEAIHKLELHDPRLEFSSGGSHLRVTVTGGINQEDAREIAEVIRRMLK